jgi:hypothetical protein
MLYFVETNFYEKAPDQFGLESAISEVIVPSADNRICKSGTTMALSSPFCGTGSPFDM